MGSIIVSQNISLDGVVQDPRGDEGLGRGDWLAMVSDRDRKEWSEELLAEATAAEALLLGRGSYEFFAARYPFRTGAMADMFNSIRKYVVSATLDSAGDWNNSTVLKGDPVSAVSALRQRLPGPVVVYASGRLVPTLLEHGLVDELRLMTYPLVVGAGRRLFGDTCRVGQLRLADARTVGDNLVFLTYRPAG